jgi:hypothetical protein
LAWYFNPNLEDASRDVVNREGWILGIL